MEPVSTLVGTIFKVLPEIAKAASTARRNRTRCRELARRADDVANVLRVSNAVLQAGGGAEAARRNIHRRLKEAVDDALALVGSCSRPGSRVWRFLTSAATAAKFDDVDKRINNCLADLSVANGASMENKINQLAAGVPRDPKPPPPRPLAHAGLPWYPKPPPPPLAHAGVRCYYPAGNYGYDGVPCYPSWGLTAVIVEEEKPTSGALFLRDVTTHAHAAAVQLRSWWSRL